MNIADRPRIENRFLAQSFRHASVAGILFVAAAAAAAVPAPAAAAEFANAPVQIRACSVVYAPQPEQIYATGANDIAGVEIDYVNATDVPAEDVTFRIGAESSGTLVTDHGSFAPGVLIRHVFWTGPNTDTSSCSVAAARLQGGTAFETTSETAGANR